jgi:hypothetical protein
MIFKNAKKGYLDDSGFEKSIFLDDLDYFKMQKRDFSMI